MRNGLLGLGQAARDDLADVAQLLGFVRNAEVRHRSLNSRRGGGGSCSRNCCAGLRTFDIGLDDPSPRAAALDGLEIDALLIGDPLGQRGCDHPVALGRRGCRSSSSCGGSSLGRGFHRSSNWPSRGSSRFGCSSSPGILILTSQRGDHRADFHPFAAFRDCNRYDRAFVDRFEFHRRLVGLDFGHDVAGPDGIARLDQPFGKGALLHRRRERGHLDFDGHGCLRVLTGEWLSLRLWPEIGETARCLRRIRLYRISG